MSPGELSRLSDSEAESLASRKWDDLLLGLAGAYSCYANGQDSFLEGTLDNLRALEPDLPDVAVLEAALDARRNRHRPEVSGRLWNAGVPVFRWGVAIGRLAAEHYGDERLDQRLRTVERGLVRNSRLGRSGGSNRGSDRRRWPPRWVRPASGGLTVTLTSA